MRKRINDQSREWGCDPLSKDFHEMQTFEAKVRNMSSDEILKEYDHWHVECLRRDERKPKDWPQGMGWSTRKSRMRSNHLGIVMDYMTREEWELVKARE